MCAYLDIGSRTLRAFCSDFMPFVVKKLTGLCKVERQKC